MTPEAFHDGPLSGARQAGLNRKMLTWPDFNRHQIVTILSFVNETAVETCLNS
jgi:hypothetical protein